jgi:hypothetical protein
VSSAYLFAVALTNGGATCPAGGSALQYLAHLIAFGAPTRALVPYQPDYTYLGTTIPAETDFRDNNYPEMERFRIGSYAAFHIDTNPPIGCS